MNMITSDITYLTFYCRFFAPAAFTYWENNLKIDGNLESFYGMLFAYKLTLVSDTKVYFWPEQ